MKRFIGLLVLAAVLHLNMVGQTREVRERVAETKGASSGPSSSSGGVRDTYDSDWDFDVEGETFGEMVASAVVFVTAYAVYTGFVWDLWDNRVQLEGRFRNSADTSVGRYRVEYSGDLGWEAARLGCFRLMTFAGYSKYTYFDDIDFSYLRLGLKLRWL